MRGLALVTKIGSRTAHLAQLAIDPDWRRRGLAAALVGEAAALAAAAGCEQMTLLVAESNRVARLLYLSMGFVERAIFTAARREVNPCG